MNVPKSWLKVRVSVEEAEAMHSDAGVPGGRAFGFSNDAWLRLKSQLRGGDELWVYDSKPVVGPDQCGNYGVCIYRGGKCVAGLLLRIS